MSSVEQIAIEMSLKGAEQVANGLKAVREQIKKLKIKEASGQFQGWAMSIMFAGMAMQKFFMDIMKKGVSSFQDIMHSVSGTTTSFDMLQGSMAFLQYTIGAALEPFVEYLIPIIDGIANWVSENEELAGWIAIIGFGLGTLLQIIGSSTLAIVNGIIPAIKLLGIAAGGFGTTLTAAFGSILIPLLVVGAAVVLIIAMWKSNIGDFQNFIKSTFGVLWETIKAVFVHIWNIIKDVFGIIVALFKGDFDKVEELAKNLLINLAALFLKGIMGLASIIVNVLVFAWNLVVDIVFKIITGLIAWVANKWIDLVTWLIDLARPLAEKLGLGGFIDKATSGLEKMRTVIDGVKDGATELADSLHAGFITGEDMKKMFGAVDSTLGLAAEVKTQAPTSASEIPTTVNNNITIEGNADQTTIDKLLFSLNSAACSPQSVQSR
jgi:hypothetical protein